MQRQATAGKQRNVEPFVKVPLWWITKAAEATQAPATLICIELLHRHWKTKSLTFPLSNKKLKRLGVSREVKRRVLRDLEHSGLISVKRSNGKAPVVTLKMV